MKNKLKLLLGIAISVLALSVTGCAQADTVQHNIGKDADNFKTYRRMTFVNLYTDKLLYSAEGYFSVQTSYSNEYQGQQELALVFKTGDYSYMMDYFSISDHTTYIIEQIENTHSDPWHWEINWYVPAVY